MKVLQNHATRLFILLLLVMILSSCGSSLMMQTQRIQQPEDQYALVTFIRPSVFGGAIQFGLWDSENLIGILSAKSYVQYLVEPGEHIFLGRAENWSYVKANLEAGKKYYILGKVFPGVWKARVALEPITKNSDVTDQQLKEWLDKLSPTTMIPKKREAYAKPRTKQVSHAVGDLEAGKVKYLTMEADDYR